MKRDDGDSGGERPPFKHESLSIPLPPLGPSVLAEIEEHWRELKSASAFVPLRSDVNPSRMARALPHAFVIERAAPGVTRFRLAGQSIKDIVKGDPKGLPLSVLFTTESRPALQNWLDRCFDAPALVDFLVKARQGALCPLLRGRLLLLPLLDGDGKVTLAMGGLLLDGAPSQTDLRFDLSDAVPRVETFGRPAPKRVFAEPASLALSGLREAERPYLRLVVFNPEKNEA